MPILKILIDDEETEFKIIPLNKRIQLDLLQRYSDKDGFIDRPGFLSHIIKDPKMSKNDWAQLPTSMITKIMRNVDYYIESITLRQIQLRSLYTQINVLEDELDDLFRYLGDDTDDWAWNRVNKIEKMIEDLKEKKQNIEKSLEALKEDKVIFEEGKEIDYDVQLLQLEDYKEK